MHQQKDTMEELNTFFEANGIEFPPKNIRITQEEPVHHITTKTLCAYEINAIRNMRTALWRANNAKELENTHCLFDGNMLLDTYIVTVNEPPGIPCGCNHIYELNMKFMDQEHRDVMYPLKQLQRHNKQCSPRTSMYYSVVPSCSQCVKQVSLDKTFNYMRVPNHYICEECLNVIIQNKIAEANAHKKDPVILADKGHLFWPTAVQLASIHPRAVLSTDMIFTAKHHLGEYAILKFVNTQRS